MTRHIDTLYQGHFGRLAGYLPQHRDALDQWLGELVETVERLGAPVGTYQSKGVTAFARLLEEDGIARMYVVQMMEQQQPPPGRKVVTTIPQLLAALDYISRTAPQYNPDPAKRNFFPMSSLFVYMMMTNAGEAAFRYLPINDAIAVILAEWCSFLDSANSQYVLNEGEYGWLSPSAYEYNKLEEFVIPDRSAPHWGWPSFNAYFHREIKPELRPIADPGNAKVIVSANDGHVYRIAQDVKAVDQFWIKSQPYSLTNMLNNRYVERFVGGSVFQSFLSGADYHRWHAPIDGVVRHAEVVHALMFSDCESAGEDPTAGTYSQGYEASVNTRGLVFIESPDPAIGMVCVIPIGITEISSVTITVRPGQAVRKGEQLGYFSYGGSSMALVFQPGAVKEFLYPSPADPEQGDAIKVNAAIAIGN